GRAGADPRCSVVLRTVVAVGTSARSPGALNRPVVAVKGFPAVQAWRGLRGGPFVVLNPRTEGGDRRTGVGQEAQHRALADVTGEAGVDEVAGGKLAARELLRGDLVEDALDALRGGEHVIGQHAAEVGVGGLDEGGVVDLEPALYGAQPELFVGAEGAVAVHDALGRAAGGIAGAGPPPAGSRRGG